MRISKRSAILVFLATCVLFSVFEVDSGNLVALQDLSIMKGRKIGSRVSESKMLIRTPVVFTISGSMHDYPRVLSCFNTYRSEDAHLLFNFYDGTLPPSNSSRIFFSNHKGHKPVFWSKIDADFLDRYDYIWFMDSDMVFDKNIFAFDQFLYLVKRLDATIATPNICGPKQDNWLAQSWISSDKFVLKAARVEQGKPLMKTKLWRFFVTEGLINVNVHELSDWGPDFFWCALAEKLGLGELDCVIIPFFNMIHLNTKTMDLARNNWNASLANDWYSSRAKKLGISHRYNENQHVELIPFDFRLLS